MHSEITDGERLAQSLGLAIAGLNKMVLTIEPGKAPVIEATYRVLEAGRVSDDVRRLRLVTQEDERTGSEMSAADRAALAQELGIDPLYLYQLLTGRREMEPKAAVRLEQRSGHRLRRWHLRAKSWHEVWPELIGVEHAPPVPNTTIEESSNAG